MYVSIYFAYMCVGTVFMPGAYRGQKRALGFLELELQVPLASM